MRCLSTLYSSVSSSLTTDDEADNDGSTTSSSSSLSSPPVTILAATFGLMKVLLGTGALALPSGLAAMSNYPHSLWAANGLMAGLGILSTYTFCLYGRLAHVTGGTTLGDIWTKIKQQKTDSQNTSATDTSNSSWVVSAANFVYCFGCCVTFALVIGDLVSSLVRAIGVTKPVLMARQTSIMTILWAIVYPLCNLQSLAALAPVSIVGVLGTLVATLFIMLRSPALVPSSPYNLAAGTQSPFLASLSSLPVFGTYHRMTNSPAPLILTAMACVAWMAHFSAPEFYQSFRGTANKDDASTMGVTSPTVALKKYTITAIAGYLGVGIVNALILSYGFLTFGGTCKGIILNNYAAQDIGASISRLLIAISVVGGFPFLFSACRSSALDLVTLWSDKKEKIEKSDTETEAETRKKTKLATTVLMSIISAIALTVEDAGFVVSFNGALMGTAIIYIFPSLLFLRHTSTIRRGNSTGCKPWRFMGLERMFCRGLIGFGVVSAVIGAITAVLNSYFPHMLR